MQYSITRQDDADICEIIISGQVTAEQAMQGLDEVWANDLYRHARFVIFDVERCEDYPDFNQLSKLVNYTLANKPAGGPTHIAYYSSNFANTMIKRVLQGLVNILPHNIVIFDNKKAALDWFPTNESDAA